MSTIKIMWISYTCGIMAIAWLWASNYHIMKQIKQKDEKILIQQNEIERLNKELHGCVSSIRTCEVMLKSEMEG